MEFEGHAAEIMLDVLSNGGKVAFSEFMSDGRQSGAHAGSIADERAALEAEFAELLAGYLAESRSLTAWDRHCLANATRFMCLGHYGQAFEQITQVRCPPVPLQLSLTEKE